MMSFLGSGFTEGGGSDVSKLSCKSLFSGEFRRMPTYSLAGHGTELEYIFLSDALL